MDNVIVLALHTFLSYLDQRNTYVRLLLIGYSSAFNTIAPTKLVNKLRDLGLNTAVIMNFLTGRPQVMWIGNIKPSTLTLSTGAPLGCMLRSLLNPLLMQDCVATTAPTPSSSVLPTGQTGEHWRNSWRHWGICWGMAMAVTLCTSPGIHGGPLHHVVREEGQQNHQRPQEPWPQTVHPVLHHKAQEQLHPARHKINEPLSSRDLHSVNHTYSTALTPPA